MHTENYGDYGYIYQDRRLWVAVTICDDGDEQDYYYTTKAEAKQVVEKRGE